MRENKFAFDILADFTEPEVAPLSPASRKVVIESLHNYLPQENAEDRWVFGAWLSGQEQQQATAPAAGAAAAAQAGGLGFLTVRLDPQSSTESHCDGLQINGVTVLDGEARDLPASVLLRTVPAQDPLRLTFHSDSSLEKWGWRLEVAAAPQQPGGAGAGGAYSAASRPIPRGVQRRTLPVSFLDGVSSAREVYRAKYDTVTTTADLALPVAFPAATHVLVAALREGEHAVFELAAIGRREAVLTPTPTPNGDEPTLREDNGVSFYWAAGRSFGFAPAGCAVEANDADTIGMDPEESQASDMGDLRLSWHIDNGARAVLAATLVLCCCVHSFLRR